MPKPLVILDNATPGRERTLRFGGLVCVIRADVPEEVPGGAGGPFRGGGRWEPCGGVFQL